MNDGILLIDKPSGLSSAQIVGAIKKALRPERVKVGHAGTLDPMATGLLVCLIGRATRLASYAQGGKKRYTGEIQLGIETTTDDITGEVLECQPVCFSDAQLSEALALLRGEIAQMPPRISAVKINGKRAYKRARAGEEFEIAPRNVTIHSFDIVSLTKDSLSFDISCSSGTYIRSLARDLGRTLGCGGTLASLRRTESAPFAVSEASSVDQFLREPTHLQKRFIPWYALFETLPRVSVSALEYSLLSNGNEEALMTLIRREGILSAGHLGFAARALFHVKGQRPQGLLEYEGGRWKSRVFDSELFRGSVRTGGTQKPSGSERELNRQVSQETRRF
ncbi:MAG: tRNA pseudouridine(55) synthase TruB [Bdellovibrionales bacterium]|nr:tRNA pseudouridine(55) synthase TruB [Bdellovibrionales bacterium]